jgi:outer membrane receptor protein involved in Fe transport
VNPERLALALVLAVAARLPAQTVDAGAIAGSVFDQATGRPVQYVALALKNSPGGQTVRTAASDDHGVFRWDDVPFGHYRVVFGLIGFENRETPDVVVDAQHRAVDLGRLVVVEPSLVMDRVVVSARAEAFYNSIDRKIYNVGQDIRSVTGSASDLLQNIPSVDVDIEGNVSLRGNGNVLILINGQTSPLMGTANRAMVLEQLPADSIEKIEVITNPSAKYKPDGTAGIINLQLKRRHDAGFSGLVRANGGNDGRYNAGLTVNYNPGKYNVFESFNVRQDDRPRYAQDTRSHLDAATNTFLATDQQTVEHSRPLSSLVQAGLDYSVDAANKLGATASYNHLTFFRTATVSNRARNAGGGVTSDYDRLRTDPEWHKTLEVEATYQHRFPQDGHELNLTLKNDRHQELEDNHYSDVYRLPAAPTTYDNTLIKPTETGREALVEYVRPYANDAKLEAGCSWEANKNDMDFRGNFLDPATGLWVADVTKTNRFIYRDAIQALYATYGQPWGQFGILAGLRMEQTMIDTNQVTTRVTDTNKYFRVYPSLHLSYNLTDTSQLQLNYSHRIHRPESDDLNPFPEYQDPYNLRAGNPQLRPEDTHSIEAGYQYKDNETTYLATVYYRYTDHAFTTISRYIDSTTLLTTEENLAVNRSGGLELAATTNPGKPVSLNFSSNAFWSEVDASNLGYNARKSTIAWSAKLNANWHVAKRQLIQLNTNFTARRLTAQGYRLPTFVANLGFRHEFRDQKTAFIVTVSDVFNSLKERTVIDTPILHDENTRRRSARIVYAGFTYNFGKPGKKPKDDSLPFDNQL